MGYDLRLLESFVALADELHFGRAALRLTLAQSALSQQIRRLETQLGTALFARDSRHVRLTAAGNAFLRHAEVSLQAAADAVDAARAIDKAAAGRLALALGPDALDHARELLRGFAAARGDLQLDVRTCSDAVALDALARRSVDAAVLWSGVDPPRGFERSSVLLGAPGMGVALRETHPLAGTAVITPELLDGQRLIMFPRAAATSLYDHLIDQLGGGDRFARTDHVTTIGEGAGHDRMTSLDDASVTPSPGWIDHHHVPAGVVYRPLAAPAESSVWLVWDGTAPRAARALAAFVDDGRAVASMSRVNGP